MKVMVVSIHNIYLPSQSGGMQCSKRNYDLLESMVGKENCWLCCFDFDAKTSRLENEGHTLVLPRTTTDLQALLAALTLRKYYYKKQETAIKKIMQQIKPDILYLEGSIYGRIASAKCAPCTILFLQNIEKSYAKNKVKNKGLQYLPAYWASAFNEKISVAQADKIICLNSRDAALLEKEYSRKPDMLLPITFADTFDVARTGECSTEKKLLFVGSLFAPNLDSVVWFVEKVMPLLPGYTLTIVGRGFEKERRTLQRENVQVIGSVEDLSTYYYSYPAVVMPIQFGDGMKVKTAEALMYGKTIFATDEALEGYDVGTTPGIYRCNAADEFANSIRQFFAGTDIPSFNPEVRALFQEKYETGQLQKSFAKLLQEASQEKPNRERGV
ncbi:MAG: glycosyltransferase [Gemmiger sp.]|nr:glycosyltransferase [Gemmiger sp.]